MRSSKNRVSLNSSANESSFRWQQCLETSRFLPFVSDQQQTSEQFNGIFLEHNRARLRLQEHKSGSFDRSLTLWSISTLCMCHFFLKTISKIFPYHHFWTPILSSFPRRRCVSWEIFVETNRFCSSLSQTISNEWWLSVMSGHSLPYPIIKCPSVVLCSINFPISNSSNYKP